MHFWLSRGSILHKLSNILLSGKSTYGLRETELYSGARRTFWEARMCLQTIYHIYATKGEITGMITRAMVILSINVRSRTLRQSRLARISVYVLPNMFCVFSQTIRFLHPILCLKILANKQVYLDRRWNCLPKRGLIKFCRMAAQFNVSFRSALICSL